MANTGGVGYTHPLQLREDKTVCGGREGREERERSNVIRPDHAASHMIILVSHVIMQPHPLSLHATANGAHELDAPSEQGEHNAAVGGIPS